MTREAFIRKWLANPNKHYDQHCRDEMRDDLDLVIQHSADASVNGSLPRSEIQKFIWEMGEDYHLWDEETQGEYPVKRMLDAMTKWWAEVSGGNDR